MPLWHILPLVHQKWRVCGAFPWRHVGETQGVKTLNQRCPLWKASLVISGVGNFLSFKVPGEREEVQKGWLQLFFLSESGMTIW